ncbi:MAG: hypothetical protein H6581_27515 [Bacteroidia bacterium]|nr:hypothetical protein [Bacteroidia bacterium]
MKRSIQPLLPLLLVLLWMGCSRDKEILVPDNTAPPDPTVENIVKENYVHRAYIGLLGRKATPTEYDHAYNLLDQANLSQSSREQMLTEIMARDEYSWNLYVQSNELLLDGTDTSEIQQTVLIYSLLLQDSAYAPFWGILQEAITELNSILDAPGDLRDGIINHAQMQRRLVDNAIYDDLNMGSLNFVISLFQKLLQRFPTSDELDQGVLMVDGFSANVFLQNGDSKSEFLDIFFASKDYAEGQVRDVFSRFLFRDPTSTEMASYSQSLRNSQSYDQLLISVLSSDEYVGVK